MQSTSEIVDSLSFRIYTYLDYKENKKDLPEKWNKEYARGYATSREDRYRIDVHAFVAGLECFLESDIYDVLCERVDKAMSTTYRQFCKGIKQWCKDMDTLFSSSSCGVWVNMVREREDTENKSKP